MQLAGVDVTGKITTFFVSTDSHSQPKSTALPATTIYDLEKPFTNLKSKTRLSETSQ